MKPSSPLSDSPTHFADRLLAAIQHKRTPLVVGLDPRLDRLPPSLVPQDPNDLESVAGAFQTFSCAVIDTVANLVPAVKPQSAFFEMLGATGTVALANVVNHARKQGLLVIMDAKRGDIGSTAEAYAQAYLGCASPWGCDALTVNPYLGADTLEPFVNLAKARGAGLFVLVKTSNPGSAMIQDLRIVRDNEQETVYSTVARWVQSLSRQSLGDHNYGCVGAVVGATYPDQLAELRAKMPNVLLLIPGLGAQGGTAADIASGFDEHGLGAIINSSRAIIFAYEQPAYECRQDNWQRSVEQATLDTIAQIAGETNAGQLKKQVR